MFANIPNLLCYNFLGILGVSYGRGINPAYIDEYSINKPNQDKKIVRITSVVGYILLVSAGIIFKNYSKHFSSELAIFFKWQ